MFRKLLALCLLLSAVPASAQCVGGVCLKPGQPVRNIVKAPLVVAKPVVKAAVRVAVAPVKATAHVVRHVQATRQQAAACTRSEGRRGPPRRWIGYRRAVFNQRWR